MSTAIATTVLSIACLFSGASFAAAAPRSGSTPAASASAQGTVAVGKDGSVKTDPEYSGPQITKVRALKERNYLEIYWNRYVDEEAAVNPDNITVTNGDKQIELVAKPKSAATDTIFFDKKNKQIAATDANSMARLPDSLHMASIAFKGTIDTSKPLTVKVAGSRIADSDGARARDVTYANVPRVNYYTHSVKTDTGIVVKAAPSVSQSVLTKAAAQVDVELAKTSTGIAGQMAAKKCSLAVYAARENVYLIPEHRGGYNPESYDVEGFGGDTYNGCVSSISERNILRTRDNPDKDLNTAYRDENILIHEFGHAVRLVGIETQNDKTLSNRFFAAYKHAYNTGLWPNTYALSNSDEFFATMSAIWFNTMSEKPDWTDGVRSPINTREELRKYDPKTYAFFKSIYPSDKTLPSPWDEPGPDIYHGDYRKLPTLPERGAATNVNWKKDTFRIASDQVGGVFQIDQTAGDPSHPKRDMAIWPQWGDGVWTVTPHKDGSLSFSASDGSGALTARSKTEAAYKGVKVNSGDAKQRWWFRANTRTRNNAYDGTLVNAANGRALVLDGRPTSGTSLTLTVPNKATSWVLEDTTKTGDSKKAAVLQPIAHHGNPGNGGHNR